MKLEELKKKYKKDWERIGDEKLFLQFVKLKEREKKLIEKLQARSEKERKRRTRALILLASMFIEKQPSLAESFIRHNKIIGKEGKQEVDYTSYILQEIERIKQSNSE